MLDPTPTASAQPTDPSTPTDPTPQDSALSTHDLPPSPQKLAANRANALRSTGPRTPEGKARSALNALTHGLRAQLDPATLVPANERPDFELLLEDFRDHLDPRSPLEHLLVERIALLAHKLRRHAQAEARLFDLPHEEALAKHEEQLAHHRRYRLKDAPPPAPTPKPAAHLLAQFARTAATNNVDPVATLQGYETVTERAFYKALRLYNAVHPSANPAQQAQTDLHHHFHYHRHAESSSPHPPIPHLSQQGIRTLPPTTTDSTNEPTDPVAHDRQNVMVNILNATISDAPDQNIATAAFGSEAVVK